MKPLEAALVYASKGWHVLPIKTKGKEPLSENGLKDATTDSAQIRTWFTKWPDANIGVACEKSGFLVIDEDPRNGGNLNDLPQKPPLTLTQKTGGGGRHLFYKNPGGKFKAKYPGVEGIDIKVNGYVLVAPSVHPNGQPYRFEKGTKDIAQLPDWMRDAIKKKPGERSLDLKPGDPIKKGDQHHTLVSLAGKMRRDGFDVDAIEAALQKTNETRLEDPATPEEIRKIAQSAAQWDQGKLPTDQAKPPKKITPAWLAERILDTDHFAKMGGKLYRYGSGYYQPDGKEYIGIRVKQVLKRKKLLSEWKRYLVDETVAFIATDAPDLWHEPPPNVLNLENGLLDLKTRELYEHSPEHLFPVQFPIIYDPSAPSNSWDWYLEGCLPDDVLAAEVPYEVLAFMLSPRRSIQKAVLVLGAGGDGKSRFLKAVQTFIGERNTSNYTLHQLENNRFAVAGLFGKTANICPDLPESHLRTTNNFKAITGGDRVTGEYKNKDHFSFRPTCRLLFSANSPPVSADGTDGFYRRWLIVPFEKRFNEPLPEHVVDARLNNDRALSGVLNRVLDKIEPIESGFTETPSMQEAFRDFREATDPLFVWADERLQLNTGSWLACDDVRLAFNRETGQSYGNSKFGKAFSTWQANHGYGIKRIQKKLNGKIIGTYPDLYWNEK